MKNAKRIDKLYNRLISIDANFECIPKSKKFHKVVEKYGEKETCDILLRKKRVCDELNDRLLENSLDDESYILSNKEDRRKFNKAFDDLIIELS